MREKDNFHWHRYKREQSRMIKGLQSQKHYKSPFPWYNIVADMLTKVISDEEKANSETTLNSRYRDLSVLKSLSSDNIRKPRKKEAKLLKNSPCTDATCESASKRSKSAEKSTRASLKRNATKLDKTAETRSKIQVKHVSCPQVRAIASISTNLEEDVVSSQTPTRDTESKVRAEASYKNSKIGFLQCPLCGWEDKTYKEIEENLKKPRQEQMYSIPCLDYNSNPSCVNYTMCTGCNKDYLEKPTNDSGDCDILRGIPKKIPCPLLNKFTEDLIECRCESYSSPVKPVVPSKNDVDVGIQYDKLKDMTKDDVSARSPIQMQFVQLNPELASKLQGSTIEACTRFKIILTDSKKDSRDNGITLQSVPQTTQGIQCNRPESCTKETQHSPQHILPEYKKNEASINATHYNDQGIQTTVCTSVLKRCVSLQTFEKQEDIYCEKDLICSMKSKGVEANIVDQASKGIQSIACVSKGNLTCCLSAANMKDTGTTPSIHQVPTIYMSSENLRKDETNTIPCIAECQTPTEYYIQDSKATVERGSKILIQGCENTCPYNLYQIVKEDPSVAFMLHQLLAKILSRKSEHGTQSTKLSKSSCVQSDYEYTCNTKDNCRLDVQKMVNKIKEHTIKILEANKKSVSKDQVKELNVKFKKSTVSPDVKDKETLPETGSYDTSTNRSTMIQENDFEPLFESTHIEDDKTSEILKDEAILFQEMKKFSSVDKGVSTYLESRDIGINGSLSQLPARDLGIQSDSKSLDDLSTKHKKYEQRRINVGTQKRDPILVRVIKCNEGQMIVKSDKETSTMGTTTDLDKICINKHIETCGRSTCMPYTICKHSKGENLEYAAQKEHENQADRLKEFKNFTCDKRCKDKACCEWDWTDVTNIDPFRNFNQFKIPFCVKPRKCTYVCNK
ncbi:uncharacterized protein LOC143177250 [Calliopsis andreniformis]|uniref:uncharacterized protein LOC143177250 n=1 Tax=Calliopsis andreniformis TaxID=337506 RepID=UPI003FCEB67A